MFFSYSHIKHLQTFTNKHLRPLPVSNINKIKYKHRVIAHNYMNSIFMHFTLRMFYHVTVHWSTRCVVCKVLHLKIIYDVLLLFVQGTMLNPYDLQRVCAERASAVLVLCNKFSPDPSKFYSYSSTLCLSFRK